MGIFGKKTSGYGIEDQAAEPQRQRKDSPNAITMNDIMPPREPVSVPPVMTVSPMPAPLPPPTQTVAPVVQKTAPLPSASPNPALFQKEGIEVNRSPYSIEDVIRLMRELPDSKKEMVVIIVQKTLLSAKIDISSIIEDAGRKMDRLQRQNDKLVSEIRELEEAIIQKKGEVDILQRDIDETAAVRQVFETTYSRHVKGEGESSATVPNQQALGQKEGTVPPATPSMKLF